MLANENGTSDLLKVDVSNKAIHRRQALQATIAGIGLSALSFEPSHAANSKPDVRRGATRRYSMKKSINQWAFPYPTRMNLRECMQLA